MATAPLEKEIGHGNAGLIPWSAFSDVTETVPELAWPSSIATYSAMRTDAQIASLLLAFTQGYIFQNAQGLPYQAHTYQQMLSYRAKRAGLPHTTSHDLRHTYASWLLAAGESVVTVAARLGHRNANMVIQTYAHIMPNSEDRTRRAIDATFKSALREPLADESAL
jgi:integrase